MNDEELRTLIRDVLLEMGYGKGVRRGSRGSVMGGSILPKPTFGTPSSIGVANIEGSSIYLPRLDHVHNHPAGLGTDLHHAEDHESRHVDGGADEIDSALDPRAIALTTRGDIVFRGGVALKRLAPGTDGQFLQTRGAGIDPRWASQKQVLVGNSNAADLSTASTEYLAFGTMTPNATESNVEVIFPVAGTLKNFRVRLGTAPGGAMDIRTFTVRKNEADTALTLNIGAGEVEMSDSVNTVSVSAGDRLCISSTIPMGTPAASIVMYGLEFDPAG